MSNAERKTPRWFLVVAIVALVWNLLGVLAFIMQATMSAETIAALPADQQRLFSERPFWVIWSLGGAVIAGAAGSVGLILKKDWAFPVLAVSLVSVVLHHTYLFILSDTFTVMGQSAMVMPLIILAIAVALVWLAFDARRKAWLS